MKRRFELSFYVSVGVGMALATASFTVVSGIFQVVSGAWVVAAVVLAGVLCVALSLSVAELAGIFPSAPGIRTYLQAALGARASLFLVYLYLIFTVLMAGVEGYTFALVFAAVAPGAPPWLTVPTLMIAVVLVNLVGLELPRGLQMLLTLATVVLLIGACGYALTTHPVLPTLVPEGGWAEAGRLPSAIGMAIFLYMGFEWITPVGLRAKAYEKQIPRSLPIAVGTLIVVYTLFVIAAPVAASPAVLGATPVPHVPVLRGLFGATGDWLAFAISLGALLSTFNAGIMGGSRIIYTLAQDGGLPAFCATLSPRTEAPIGAVLTLGTFATLAAMVVVTFHVHMVLAVIGAAIMCLIYAAFMLSAVRLRQRKPQLRRPYRSRVPLPLQIGVTVVFAALAALTLFSLPALATEMTLWMAGCLIVAGLFTFRPIRKRDDGVLDAMQ